ncbi:S-adenosyl-L-methionine-dependent methyltransferase [Lepidopterella palustris CBS 459.81]|uniref:S-adenosyl-L-methionine-dependent methyltransferase n=1 Tax=Lepidopterella palustris CBS 459.81 TaxID=1314670 RepID=A0A8E2E8W0_9PEZI|nr:S-adenosyl-L-methionine-dependent methyltransferase [Lepidopterella palustris CBS 459.81]
MTQPSSLNMTFDTSLIDLSPENSLHHNAYPSNLQGSFSTTESEPSDGDQQAPITFNSTMKTPTLPSTSPNPGETPKASQNNTWTPTVNPTSLPKSSTPVQQLPTLDTYNAWASVYDTDGNILQAIDDLELASLLPEFLALATSAPSPDFSIIDLGCGTGRNTAKLLSHPYPSTLNVSVTGLDFSSGMLAVAEQKLFSQLHTLKPNIKLTLQQADCFPSATNPSTSPSLPVTSPSNAIISTLVLEHIPLTHFFATLATLLQPSGLALVTNMHREMGSRSQAGFVGSDGKKVQGTSFVYGVEETVEAAREAGFELVEIRERGMKEEDVSAGRVSGRGVKWVGCKVWYGVVLRRV